jgi:hypothetical protein
MDPEKKQRYHGVLCKRIETRSVFQTHTNQPSTGNKPTPTSGQEKKGLSEDGFCIGKINLPSNKSA